ncbi:Low density lipoprotein receptor adapter protein 1 [Trachymyrmex cornetzi]|uniref:Low density lipoprotein receptor adapter protein 1 n=1 Tax=Trachymyrmex cornetzi TaxID=471704 RepID=A0A151J242_9HYME|nr:Low density lipoprotein receptor adapter protein 1 [Trachymyrmex cornetzi]
MSWTGAKLASRFVSERRALEREKAGEADRDKGKDFGAAGIACTALGQNVVLQGFVEEQFEAQERRAVRTSNNNELAACAASYSERLSSRNSSWDEERAPLLRSFRPNDGYPGEMTNNTAKASGKKLQRVSLAVSLRGIRMTDLATEEDQLQVSIYRISYCSADATHDHVFAFIATNLNETMECHAFLCPKRKMAQTVTLTVAQAFNTAYQAWQLSQSDPRIHHAQDKSPPSTGDRIDNNEKKSTSETKTTTGKINEQNKQNGQQRRNDSQKNLLIDLSNDPKPAGNSWVCFEEDSDVKKNQKKSAASNNSIPMTTLRHHTTASTTPAHHVVPRPSAGFKVQNAWGESRSVDLMCS